MDLVRIDDRLTGEKVPLSPGHRPFGRRASQPPPPSMVSPLGLQSFVVQDVWLHYKTRAQAALEVKSKLMTTKKRGTRDDAAANKSIKLDNFVAQPVWLLGKWSA